MANEKRYRQSNGKTPPENYLCRLSRVAVTCCSVESKRKENCVEKQPHASTKMRCYRVKHTRETEIRCGTIPYHYTSNNAIHSTHTWLASFERLKIVSFFLLSS